jgi:NADPH2:quinone reductase
MRAVRLVRAIGPDGLSVDDVVEPAVSDDSAVVDLHVAGVSFPDLLQTSGSYQMVAALPAVLGAEGAGIVRSAPADSGLRAGQRVAVLALGGAWQQTVSVEPRFVFPIPDSVSLAAGSALLLNYLTVHFALEERARYRPGETVLVHGAAGGIGTAALQVAAALGLETIAVVSSEQKAIVAADNRATHTVLVDGFKDRVLEITGGRGVDVVLDPVGGDRFLDSLRSLATGGRVVVLGFTGGEIPTVKVNRLLLRNVAVVGAGWGEHIRSAPSYPRRQWEVLEPLLHDGSLRVSEPSVVPMDAAAAALRSLGNRTAIGKIALGLR